MKNIEVVCGIIEKNKEYLVGRRSFEKSFPGLLEFPGGTVEGKETPVQALEREISEEFPDMKISIGNFFGKGYYRDENIEIKLFGYCCRYVSGLWISKVHIETFWSNPRNLNPYEFAPADISLVRKLQKESANPRR